MSKAEAAAYKAYPKEIRDVSGFVIDIGYPQYMRDLYVEGYHQAEKDLELSWEDIPKIFSISEQLKTSWWFRDNEQTKQIGTQVFWEEVLKLFKKKKNNNMTREELSEELDKFIKEHQPELPKEWEKDISFKQSQILYTGMLQKRKETLTFEDIDAAYLEGGMMARRLFSKKYEKLLGFIDLLSHGALTQDQHDLLDKILEYTGESEEVFKRIHNIYSTEELLNNSSPFPAPEQEQ